LGGCGGHWGSLSLNNNWLWPWRCRLRLDRLDRLRLDRLDGLRLDGLDGLCRSLAPLASSLARPLLLWYLGLLPLSSPLSTRLATWETSRLPPWEATLHRSWEATSCTRKAPLVVGLAESQRAARGAAEHLLARGGRGQRLGGSGEHASKG
jgi:hypothetical protein